MVFLRIDWFIKKQELFSIITCSSYVMNESELVCTIWERSVFKYRGGGEGGDCEELVDLGMNTPNDI